MPLSKKSRITRILHYLYSKQKQITDINCPSQVSLLHELPTYSKHPLKCILQLQSENLFMYYD